MKKAAPVVTNDSSGPGLKELSHCAKNEYALCETSENVVIAIADSNLSHDDEETFTLIDESDVHFDISCAVDNILIFND